MRSSEAAPVEWRVATHHTKGEWHRLPFVRLCEEVLYATLPCLPACHAHAAISTKPTHGHGHTLHGMWGCFPAQQLLGCVCMMAMRAGAAHMWQCQHSCYGGPGLVQCANYHLLRASSLRASSQGSDVCVALTRSSSQPRSVYALKTLPDTLAPVLAEMILPYVLFSISFAKRPTLRMKVFQ